MENDKLVRKNTQDNFVTENYDIIKNNLLGDYDDNGNYFISPLILCFASVDYWAMGRFILN